MVYRIEDMQKLLRDEKIPEVDVTQKVMDRIYELEAKKRPIIINRKVAIILLALFVCATGYASINMFNLFDWRGEVSLQYGKLIAPTSLNDILAQSAKLRDEMLKEGEAIAFFWVLQGIEDVEDGSLKVVYMQKPYEYLTPEATIKHPGLYLKTIPKQLYGYQFAKSIIQNRMPRLWNQAAVEVPAYQKTTLYKTERVEVLQEIQSCTLEYKKNKQIILVDIDPWVSNTRFSNRLQELGMTKITLTTSEALFVVEGAEKMVIWVREGADYGYVCSVKGDETIADEELIELARAVDCWELPMTVDFSTRRKNLP